MGLVHWASGRFAESIECHTEALGLARETGRNTELAATMCLAETHCDAGNDRMAEQLAAESLALAR